MSPIDIDFDADVKHAVEDLPAAYRNERTGLQYNAVIQEIKLGESFDDVEGVRDAADFMIVQPLSDFADDSHQPEIGDKITIVASDQVFRVTEVEPDPTAIVSGVSGAVNFFITQVTG